MAITRFAIADYDVVFRKILVSYLCSSLDRKVVFCSSDGRELLEKANGTVVDILVVNLFLPVMSGIESIQRIRYFNKEVKILAVSSVFQPDMASILLKYNVNGYCSKNIRDILKAFVNIQEGGVFFDWSYFNQWKENGDVLPAVCKSDEFIGKINPTEIKIVVLCCQGMTNREIASKLNFSTRTVETYLSKLLAKLDIKSRHELISMAFNNGICRLLCRNSQKGYCELESMFL